MRLLISDANILIDMEAGELLKAFFDLPFRFGIPNSLYSEEIEAGTPGLDRLGLELIEVSGQWVEYAFGLATKYTGTFGSNAGTVPSHNDYLALAAAKQEACGLLTGDKNLRRVAVVEDVSICGTVWVLDEMLKAQILTVEGCHGAVQKMKEKNRRLPWTDISEMMNGHSNH